MLDARHSGTGQPVALKLLLRPESEVVRARFRQEAQVLARLQHPGVVGVHACGELPSGLPYLALARVPGVDLRTRIEQDRPSPAWSAQRVALLADAVEHLHQRGVVHRDLKPANVLLAPPDERPVLVDFGLVQRDPAKLALSSLDDRLRLTASGATPGTPAYMPPEQIDASDLGPVGPRSDVYGLGAVLYACLTGEPPFAGATPLNTLVAVLKHPPRDPRELNPAVPADLAALCLRCLAKHPSDRPPSAAALAEALRGESVPSAPALDHAARRRLRWGALPLAALLLGALGLVAVQLAARRQASPPSPLAATPTPSAQPYPSWFDPDQRDMPPWPLPATVAFLDPEVAHRYVNRADGSELVWVPPGTYPLGDADSFVNPAHEATLPGFFVGVHEVSRAQYAAFCAARGADLPEGVLTRREGQTGADNEDWRQPEVFVPEPEHPIGDVTHAEVLAYCAWAQADLPTSDEWEAAARGADGRTYPWGDAPPGPARANLLSKRDPVAYHYLAPVDSHREGRSPFGCHHMAGNVAELTRDPGAGPDGGDAFWARGGHGDRQQVSDAATFDRSQPKPRSGYQGFRIVVRAPR